MNEAQWYCADCETHGGGPPNYQTMEEHVEQAHDGVAARMIEGNWRDWERRQDFRKS